MGVYRSKKTPFWQFDFVIQGRRFHGSTGQESKRAALAFERRRRVEAAEGRLDDAAQVPLDLAADRWWREVGSARGDSDDVARRLEAVVRLIGPHTKLCDIDMQAVSGAIQARRAETFRKTTRPGAKRYVLSDSTVNRDIIEHLRPVLRRASKHWGARGLHDIDWKELRLREPSAEVRWYPTGQQQAWLDEAAASCEAAGAALRMLLVYGLRFGELFFHIDRFDPEGARITLPGHTRKKDSQHHLPLRADDARDLAARIGRARAAGLATAWFFVDSRGRLAPLTYGGLQSRLRAAARRAGLTEPRLIHGSRHHAGVAILRKSKNLAVAKKLLGHVSITSTVRYAQALEDDVRAALEDEAPRNGPGLETPKTETAS